MKKGEHGRNRARGENEGHLVPPKVLRAVGAVLILLVVLPVYAFAPPGVPGSPEEHLRSLAGSYYGALIFGGAGIALVTVPLAFTRLPRRVADLVERMTGRLLLAPRPWTFAAIAGAISGLLTLFLSAYAFSFRPALLDATSQLVHARYLAAGQMAGPELTLPEFFIFQFMVNLPSGWASQYPPGHIALLAVGFGARSPWIIGPVLVAVTVILTARAAEEIFPEDVLAARLGTTFLASSLFFLGHAATYMNHVTAAAFSALAVLGGLRGSREGKGTRAWLVAAGIATGMVFATRPVAGIAIGIVALAFLYLSIGNEPGRVRNVSWLRRLPFFAAGCLPPLALLGAYNQLLFGGPARFGYLVAEGSGHGMGFHRDPWGNMYGPLDGLVQTSRDLLALGLDLLVTPLSAVLVIGAYLLSGPTRPRALPLLLCWALLPVVAHFFYWHQDLFMGPRLLTEFTPPWAMLTGLSVLELVRRTRRQDLGPGRHFDRYGALVSALLLAAVAAIVILIPQRLSLYRLQWGPEARLPAPIVEQPSVVFVQGQWSERLGARLAAHGMRVDSIRAALRFNTSCEVQGFLDAREVRQVGISLPAAHQGASSARSADPLHFQPRSGIEIREMRLDQRVTVWTYPNEKPTPECLRQANADRRGALMFPELLWQGDLPGLPQHGAMFVRDMGPELNPRILELHRGRRPRVYLRPEPHLPPVLVSYEEGMRLLWGSRATISGPTSSNEPPSPGME